MPCLDKISYLFSSFLKIGILDLVVVVQWQPYSPVSTVRELNSLLNSKRVTFQLMPEEKEGVRWWWWGGSAER